jgi:hypothetical protein
MLYTRLCVVRDNLFVVTHKFPWRDSFLTGTVECPDFDSNPERECGGGLHLSPTPTLALSFNTGKLLKCEVMPEDVVVHKHGIEKVRVRKVKVLGPCDRDGNLI